MSERWRETYDNWKLASPPEEDGPAHPCKRCGKAITEDEGGADDLDPETGFVGADVCDLCWQQLEAAGGHGSNARMTREAKALGKRISDSEKEVLVLRRPDWEEADQGGFARVRIHLDSAGACSATRWWGEAVELTTHEKRLAKTIIERLEEVSF